MWFWPHLVALLIVTPISLNILVIEMDTDSAQMTSGVITEVGGGGHHWAGRPNNSHLTMMSFSGFL